MYNLTIWDSLEWCIIINAGSKFWNCDFGGGSGQGICLSNRLFGDSKSYWNLRNKGLVISNEPRGKMWKQVAVKWVHMCLREWILRANKTYSFYSINIYWLTACWALPVVVFSPSFSGILFFIFYFKSLHDVWGT